MKFLSIIIPSYNSEKTILPLLASVESSEGISFEEMELIIVDDGSGDGTVAAIEHFFSVHRRHVKTVRIIQLAKNVGPAKARNIGAKYAKGTIILFLDADIRVYPKTIREVVRSFRDDADLYALTGVWDKKQKSNRFFRKFKALRDWSYWLYERDPKNYYYLFSTRVAAIDRGLFMRLGGFNQSYRAALVEDIELTYRIARRHAVIFNPKVIVHHEFEDFIPVAKKYFWRSYYWSQIYRKRKKFDPVATTAKEALTGMTAGVLTLMAIVFSLSYVSHIGLLREMGLITGAVFLIHLWCVRHFLWFCAKEEGVWFAIKSFFTGIVLYLIIIAGTLYSWIKETP